MLITYLFLALLFIVGLISTFLSFPTKNKFTAWLQSFSLQTSPSNMVQAPNSDIVTTANTTIAEKVVMKRSGGSSSSSNQFKAELKSVFATFDKNSDGYITKQELKDSLKNIGITMTEKDMKEMVERVDSNGDGLIDLDEFCELFESIASRDQEVNGKEGDGEVYLKEAFDVFDGDGDGVITVEELGLVLSSLGFKEGKKLENCKDMIQKVDMDGDGMINFDEFKNMMKAGERLLPVS